MRALFAVLLAIACTGCALFRPVRGSDALDITFEGATTFGASRLREVIEPAWADFDKTPYRKSAIDDLAYEIERFYNGEGFPFTAVTYDFTDAQAGSSRAHAVLRIDEGPRTVIEAITFEGNRAIDARTLRELFGAGTSTLLRTGPLYYIQNQVDGARDEILRDYRGRGYLDATVSAPEVTFDPDRGAAQIHVTIVEGLRYALAGVTFDGEIGPDQRELERLAQPFLERPYSDRIALEIAGRVEEWYADRGFADVAVERRARDAGPDGRVRLTFAVVPGARVTIAAIEVHGARKTKDRFIRSRVELATGEPYSRSRERESHRRLYQTGLFKDVKLALQPRDGDGTQRTLVVDLTESETLEVFVEPGYGSYERWRIGGGVREKNLFGQGLVLQGEGTLAALAQRGKLSLIDPWFLGSDVSADLSLFGNQRQEPSFDRREVGVGVDFKRRYQRFYETNLGYQFKRSATSNVEISDPIASEDVNISSIALTQTYDARDDVIATKHGLLTKGTLEYADRSIGSELDFLRVRLTQGAFVGLDPATTLGFSLRTGVIAPTHDTDSIPLQERFFNGGENTVRSFQENELGPKDAQGNPIGGEAWSVASVELRHALYGHVEGAIFYDLGNVVLDYTDFLDFRGYREALGIGVRYELPVGPLRLDWGVNPDPDGDEVRSVLHFSVGMAF